MSREKNHALSKSDIIRIFETVIEIALVLFVVALTVYLFPEIMKLKEDSVREEVRSFVLDSGLWGVLCMIGIQLSQIILSIIPGEPVEVLFGFIYGPWIGALLCLCSIALGSFVVFSVTRALGKKFMKKVEESGKYKKLSFLHDPRKRDSLVFLLFFLPGTPKDTITYFVPFTKMSLGRFLVISTIGRIPSVITSTFAGDSIFTGNYSHSIIIFAITGVLGIGGILVYNYILAKNGQAPHEKSKNKNEEN